jgi:hypothetical protein
MELEDEFDAYMDSSYHEGFAAVWKIIDPEDYTTRYNEWETDRYYNWQDYTEVMD